MRTIGRIAAAAWAGLACLAAAPPAEDPKPDPKRIADLVRRLGDDEFEVREASGEALRRIGAPAVPALEKGAGSTDPEVRSRSEELLESVRARMAEEEAARKAFAIRAEERAWLRKEAGNLFGAGGFPADPGDAAKDDPRLAPGGVPIGGGHLDVMERTALGWLAAAQEADGRWDSRRHGAKRAADVEQTALALLAFLCAGHATDSPLYSKNVRLAIEWLKKRQGPDGAFRNPGAPAAEGIPHALAALAMAESCGMGCGGAMESAQKAVDYSLNAHRTGARTSPSGFGRAPGSAAPDLLTMHLFVLHLKSAKIADLKIPPESFEGIRRFVESMRDPATGRFRLAAGLAPSARATALGVGSLLMLGESPEKSKAVMEAVAREIRPTTGRGDSDDLFNYAATWSLGQAIGLWHLRTHEFGQALLLEASMAQEKDGSFPPSGEWIGAGRAFSTALNALAIETVNFRGYMPVYK